MENKFTILHSVSDASFSSPVAGNHRLYVHLGSSGAALLVAEKEPKKARAFQALSCVDNISIANGEAVKDLLGSLALTHEWFADTEVTTDVLIPGTGFNLIPESVVDSYSLEQLIDPMVPVSSFLKTHSYKLNNYPAVAVYRLPWNWNFQLNNSMREIRVYHEDCFWIDCMFSSKNKLPSGNNAVIYIDKEVVKILLLKDGQLMFFNSFFCGEGADILYYLKLCLDKNDFKIPATTVLLAGPRSGDNEIIAMLRKYFSSVKPLMFPPSSVFPGSMKQPFSLQYLALFSALLCGS